MSAVMLCLVFALCVVTNVFVDGMDTVPIGTYPGSGHVACTGVSCPNAEAQCIDRKCVCRADWVGTGALGCVPGNQTVCGAINDPGTLNLMREYFHVNTPCAYRLTNFHFYKPQVTNWQTRCNVQIDASNVRNRGKLSVGGVDVRVQIHDSIETHRAIFRTVGSFNVTERTYKFSRQIVDITAGIGWQEPSQAILNFDYNFQIDEQKKRMTLTIPACGLNVFFRPAHPTLGQNQERTPGVLFAINNEEGETLWDRTADRTICMAPPGVLQTSIAQIATDNNLSTDEAAARLVYLNNRQRFSYISNQCGNMYTAFDNCPGDRVNQAINVCNVMLTTPHFMECYSRENSNGNGVSDAITELFTQCVNAICNQSYRQCEAVKAKVNPACRTQALRLSFMRFACWQWPTTT